jgi:O-acetyl-ADP-ribose deacetylase (regulator of RNase III)
MIVFEERADILESGAQTLVVPVNTVGAMGKGLALAFRRKYPTLYPAYRRACRLHVFEHEGMFIHEISEDRKILCFPTKHHWRQPSKLEWIIDGLELLVKHYGEWGITKLAVPALGCGEGKLDWPLVEEVLWRYLDPLELEVGIYLPPE